MNSLRVTSLKRQQGSFYSTAIIVALFGFFLLAALKIAPAYLDNNTVMNTINGMKERGELATMSVTEIRTSLMRTLNTNRVEDFEASSVVITKEGGAEFVDINYESRVSLFYNIDAVVKFQNRVEKL